MYIYICIHTYIWSAESGRGNGLKGREAKALIGVPNKVNRKATFISLISV